jgi:hypothetical protein
MKILVIQIKIGNNDFTNSSNLDKYFEFEKNICLPSVKNWAQRCGYDYKLITESSIENNNFFKTVQHKYSAERLMHLYHEDYDYIIYVDADVYVTDNAMKFPIKNGLLTTTEYIDEKKWNQRFPGINHTNLNYINAGIYSVDKETGKKISKYFLNRLQMNDNKNIVYADQDILNAWQFENGFEKLNDSWNYMLWHKHIDPKEHNTNSGDSRRVEIRLLLKQNYSELKNANFIHFVGNTKHIFDFFYRMINNDYEYNFKPLEKEIYIPKMILEAQKRKNNI